MDKDLFYILTTKYLSGESTLQETDQLNEYLEQEYFLELFLKINETWLQKNKQDNEHIYDYNRGLTLLRNRIAEQAESKPIPVIRPYKKYFAVAAILAGLALSVVLLMYGFKNDMVSITAQNGEIKQFDLPDGSHIALNAGSTLSFPSKFEEPTREVYLTGEALFKVKSDKTHPFIVHTSNYATKAVGTVFNIKAFTNENHIIIALMKGKVLISNAQHALNDLALLPMQMLTVDKKTGKTSIESFNSKLVTSWEDHELRFKEEPLPEAFNSIARKYGITISYNEKLFKNCRVNANFTNESVTQVLEALKFALRFNYKITTNGKGGQVVIINGSGC
jgi:ferric-dicitrate binding protein FerR (iron transport regulator)